MTKFRKKKRLRIRTCKVNLAIKCKKVFYHKSRKAIACKPCRNYLKNIGMNIEKFMFLKKANLEPLSEKKIREVERNGFTGRNNRMEK